jgi:CRP/FNR family transcriptional regulator, cyclic AMP receptor protein
MHTLEVLLPESEMFKGLAPEQLELIAGCAKNVRFAPGEQIFRHGEQADTFYLVREGEVATELWVSGRGSVRIETLGAGEVVGWSWLIPPYRWHLDAHALDPVRALAFDGACLRRKASEDHDLGYELLQRFSARLVLALEATRLRLLDVYGPVA